jgi:hypothetical protein
MPSYDLSLAYLPHLGHLSLPMPTLSLPMLTYAYLWRTTARHPDDPSTYGLPETLCLPSSRCTLPYGTYAYLCLPMPPYPP